jgi:hypothetical protein
LRDQAVALDLAREKGDTWAISQANRVFLELRTAAGLTAPPPADDPLDDFIRSLTPDVGDPARPG